MGEGIRAGLDEIADWLGVRCDADQPVEGVSTDSRTLNGGELFIALRGPNHDGHEHVAAAAERGAVAAIVERRLPIELPQLLVSDTRIALGRTAAAWRRRCGTRLVAVTGSNGKTTVKEMIAAILSEAGPTLFTRGNLNNDIGVPLTLLRLTPEHRFGVIEMGANHPGEIAYLTELTRPDVAVITNAGAAHLEGFGTIAGVARAKGEIYGGLSPEGTAVINADDPYAPLWEEMAGTRATIRFGLERPADISGRWQPIENGSRVEIRLNGEALSFDLALPGRHNVLNALAAAAVASALRIAGSTIAAGLGGVQGTKGRLRLVPGIRGSRIIDDTYNANPDSLRSGLEVLASYPGKRYLALGDMAELGPESRALHAEAGRMARSAGVERLYATGGASRAAVEAFGENGCFFPGQAELIEILRSAMEPGVTLLVKGSRSAGMERTVTALAAGGDE